MKSSLKTPAVITGLIVSGGALSAWSGAILQADAELDVPLNVFGINGSPYGEVFAMAIQGTIDKEFHVGHTGQYHDHDHDHDHDHSGHKHDHSGHDHDHSGHNHAPDEPCNHPSHDHSDHSHDHSDHSHDHSDHSHDDHSDHSGPGPASSFPLESVIAAMRKGHNEYTNPLPASPALKRHFLQATEKSLRFAYKLDPANYANYTALQMFMVEGINGQPESATNAASLAEQTIDYCLAQKDDPRPHLTAAAACSNLLLIMFNEHRLGHDTYDISDMRRALEQFDDCLKRYQTLAASWIENGNWERLSPARIEECNGRYELNTIMRELAAKTIQQVEKQQEKP